MIELRGISRHYKDGREKRTVIEDLDLNVKQGEFVSILGPSGSGKSTLLNILGLLDKPDSGTYRLAGQDVTEYGGGRLAAIRNRHIGFIFQQFMLVPRLTVGENVALPLQYTRMSAREKRKRVDEALEWVGMLSRKKDVPVHLSGGQKQKVAIARAIVASPSLLLADEPTGNLDAQSKQEVINILQRLHAQGKTIMLVTHDYELARIAERILYMLDRKLVPYRGAPEREANRG
ncbi:MULTISPECIES: ABC transporter ATP-binding protein [Aneurinibacillus]|jgi:putative ABC transport system ATP-binding protein|uniref:Putative ABC transport system ATP-binding protein n=1 Tax=Aneurinibacillus thermoaerophilus TaxID=143495 RepID=A0A1G7ZYJ5_ANETH|nr:MULTISPECIES: ABC transporter ATP-binding protein [Aneurinibacillus]AMA71678.1 macrolide ABC transporter ATP-binding protein [Aneurinibacillus sp. XH2]MED0738393.1 ABC transporter ATP-binding protein [Aneurinibacillus thermoaerophilus]MED0757665.1 ABC transporter ATP-binding protein [Aneurinibacillus thermoaerophilus]MED0759304.1 ABC transporter ATP-binding protein [Aneurinibacillus thermoaerophilus]SDH13732.1 putative ABC transport system ATP-binding protein [Aneurinibacillus thermoaerophi